MIRLYNICYNLANAYLNPVQCPVSSYVEFKQQVIAQNAILLKEVFDYVAKRRENNYIGPDITHYILKAIIDSIADRHCIILRFMLQNGMDSSFLLSRFTFLTPVPGFDRNFGFGHEEVGTLLHIAAKTKKLDPDLIPLLLEHNVSLLECTDSGKTPVYIAVKADNIVAVGTLCAAGAKLNGLLHSPLTEAVHQRLVTMTIKLLELGAFPHIFVIKNVIMHYPSAWLRRLFGENEHRPDNRYVDETAQLWPKICAHCINGQSCTTVTVRQPEPTEQQCYYIPTLPLSLDVTLTPLHVHIRKDEYSDTYTDCVLRSKKDSCKKIEILVRNGLNVRYVRTTYLNHSDITKEKILQVAPGIRRGICYRTILYVHLCMRAAKYPRDVISLILRAIWSIREDPAWYSTGSDYFFRGLHGFFFPVAKKLVITGKNSGQIISKLC